MEIEIRQLVNATDEELDGAAECLHEANDRRFFIEVLDKDPSKCLKALRAYVATAYIGGEVYVAEKKGRIVGVALWFGPGQKLFSTEEQRKAGWDDVVTSIPKADADWWAYFFREYDGMCEKLFGPGVKLASYHLQIFGVRPEEQKKGYGGALVKVVEEKAFKSSPPTALVLETVGDTNVGIYKRWGFTEHGPHPIKFGDIELGWFCLQKNGPGL